MPDRRPRGGPAIRRGWFVERRTLRLAAMSTTSVGLLLFAFGALVGTQWAARRWVPTGSVLLAALPVASHPAQLPAAPSAAPSAASNGASSGAPSATPAAAVRAHPPVEPDPPLAQPLAAAPPPAAQPTPPPPVVTAAAAEPLLPAWARDGLLPVEEAPRRRSVLLRLSRAFAATQEPDTAQHPFAIDLGPDGRPQLRFLASHQPPDVPFGPLIYRAAREHALNPRLLAAVVHVESSFDPRAVSRRGARGLMQVMPDTARRFGVAAQDLFDPEANLFAGARYLGWLTDRYRDDLPRVLAAYNAGEGVVDRYGGIPPFPETREYVQRTYSALGLATPEAVRGSRPRDAG
jgi:soluble lytic murein transglycosylase-like protein